MPHPSKIVDDGYTRARQAIEPRIRAEVGSKFVERLQAASWFGRLCLRWKMRREIEQLIAEKAPQDALY